MLSLLRLERKQTNSSNLFGIRIFHFLSYSFGIETINTFKHSRSSLENHTQFQTKMGKVPGRFQTKTAQKPYPIAYIREYPPPRGYSRTSHKWPPKIQRLRSRLSRGTQREYSSKPLQHTYLLNEF